MSSAHPDLDVRIFFKECVSLANRLSIDGIQSEVHLVLSGVTERTEQGVQVHSVVKAKGRLARMWTTVNRVYQKAITLDGDIYHFHDPELLRIALKLKRKGKIVIYDAHEDLPRQILGKPYLKGRTLLSRCFEWYENFVVRKLDAVITATPFIRDRFLKLVPNTIDINNYPLESEIELQEPNTTEKENAVCFIGGISAIRGTLQVVQAMAYTTTRLDLAGGIPEAFKKKLNVEPGWKQVNELGFIDRKRALEVKKKAFAGIVTFLPLPNHINAQPNKIFEYMASGLPVIGSDFPLWREIILDNNAGLCVDPTNPEAIAQAIQFLNEHPEQAIEMGANGRRIVEQKYNWRAEEKKLCQLYKSLLEK
jgi:glycosyltransferase involved in cell wall biosynthesis